MGFYRDGLALAPALVPLHRINDRRMLVDVVDDERIRLRHIACQVARIGVVAAVLGENEGRFRRGIHPGDRVRSMTAFHIFSARSQPMATTPLLSSCAVTFAQFSSASQVRCVSTFTTTGGTISSAVTFTFCGSGNIPSLVRCPNVVNAVVLCFRCGILKLIQRRRFFLRGDRIAL